MLAAAIALNLIGTVPASAVPAGLDDTPVPESPSPLDRYNVVWDSPSENCHGSMPLGNGDIGLNVWVEKIGDLVFYIGKSDAWSDSVRLLKLGRVRVRFSPNPFAAATDFRQELKFAPGEIEIRAGDSRVRVWVDAHRPIIRVEAEAAHEFDAVATLETWRDNERVLEKVEEESASATAGAPGPCAELADTIHKDDAHQTIWYHRNTKSSWPATMRLQGLGDFATQSADPLLGRTFGGVLEKSPGKNTRHLISVYVLTQQTPAIEDWLSRLEAIRTKGDGIDLESERRAHRRWWYEFWDRSWIRIDGAADAAAATFGYTAQRYLNACTGRGAYPIKFNGATLSVDARPGAQGHIKAAYDADYRSWGGGYWFQNTRLIYWPMLESGDFDLMRPFFKMYRDALPLAQARTKIYFGHDGAFFPETMCFWGTYMNGNYGWDRAGKESAWVENLYIRYYWQGGIELCAMMLDYYAFTEDFDFLRYTLLPFSDEILRFYDQHYARDAAGKILMEPAQSLETWWTAVNPLPDVAGLQYVLDRLLAMSSNLITQEQRATWERLKNELPPIPTRQTDKGAILSPAETYTDDPKNSENTELYAIFPYKIYGVNKPDLELANRSFDARRTKQAYCWYQDDAELALLGRAQEARERVAKRFSRKDEGSRFPGFWGPNNDYTPDFDNGGEGQVALQAMLVQYDGDKILLFPAWPKDWDVEFKLRAPKNTEIQGVYREGKLEKLQVDPAFREKDIVKRDPQ